MTIPKKEGLFIAVVLFLTLGAAVSAQTSFRGANPFSILFVGLVLFTVCSAAIGCIKIVLYNIWHSESSRRAKSFYLVSSAFEVASCLVIGFIFHFSEVVMFSLLLLYWVLEVFINPFLLRRISPIKHTVYARDFSLSLVQAFALPALGFAIYLITGLAN